MADKYINRDKLLEAYGDCIVTYCLYPKHGTFPTYGETGLWDYIKTMPTIEAEPVKHGTWTKKESKRYWWYECSECGSYPPSDRYRREWLANYCPNCGAKMDEVEK